MISPIRRLLLSALLVILSSASVSAYTYRQTGVDSNLLIDDEKVYFAQSDGSLTILDLNTGSALARKQDSYYSGTLKRIKQGILLLQYGKIALFDAHTLNIIWQTNHHYDPINTGDKIVSYDGNGLVECRDIATGRVLWSYDLPGALELAEAKGRILVFRSAEYEPDRVPAVVILELQTGREILHKSTPPKTHFLDAYFDGDKIYLQAGNFQGTCKENSTNFEQGRPSARFEKLLIWDIHGNEIASIPISDDFKLGGWYSGFAYKGKYFAENRVWDTPSAIQPLEPGRGRSKTVLDERKDNPFLETEIITFKLPDGVMTTTSPAGYAAERAARSNPAEVPPVDISLKTRRYSWKGRLPYLIAPGKVEYVSIEPTRELLLIGSNSGHVECVDLKSGKSLWLYVFPTMRQTVSYSSHGMPPHMADAARTFREENSRKPESGLIIDGVSTPSASRIIFDPSPYDPYKYLLLYTAIAWFLAIIPPIAVIFLYGVTKKRSLDRRIPAVLGFLLALSAAYGLFNFGRVSFAGGIALRLSVIIALAGAYKYSIACIRDKRYVFTIFLILMDTGFLLFTFPVLLNL